MVNCGEVERNQLIIHRWVRYWSLIALIMTYAGGSCLYGPSGVLASRVFFAEIVRKKCEAQRHKGIEAQRRIKVRRYESAKVT